MNKGHGNVLIKGMTSFLVELPTPAGISYLWNFGSMLAFCLGLQIVTGLFLAMHYNTHSDLAFLSVIHMSRDVVYGQLIHSLHANGGSLFFVCMYLHIGRGLYYFSYTNKFVWSSGIIIFLLVMMTAFLGYVLPWGQMSFWGATVITNLVSAVPYWGSGLVQWLWGGYSVGNPTLVRFFAFHFLLPFVVSAFVLIHLVFLHETGSKNPLGVTSDILKMDFHPYFTVKDALGLVCLLLLFGFIVVFYPQLLGDCENFIPANPLVTPEHIQPEWYFLFAYAILRSIPNSLGGVMALVLSIIVFFLFNAGRVEMSSGSWFAAWRICFWWFTVVFILLTWIGMRAVEDPFVVVGQYLTVIYFTLLLIMWMICSKS